jgi:thermitase
MANEVVGQTLKGKWEVNPLGRDARDFEIIRAGRTQRLKISQAWNLLEKLRSHRDVASAEPALLLPGLQPDPDHIERLLTPRELKPLSRIGLGDDLPCAKKNDEWSLDLTRTKQAWKLEPGEEGKRFGEGVVVAHPDTGYTRHPEIWLDDPQTNRVLASEGYDYVDDDPDAFDPLEGSFPGHGTSTASVIMSDHNPGQEPKRVSGTAPLASLVPFRVSTSVIHFSFRNVTKAIYRAAEQKRHVISMSLGGPIGFGSLQRAIQHAIDQGIVVLAAAGNIWPSVVYPAKFDEVIAVAACNCKAEPWSLSSRGREVDVTAPGESVWRAQTDEVGGPYSVEMSNGTSYAVAVTAGACALWLAFHGRDRLIRDYGAENVPSIFKELLMRHGVDTPPEWDQEKFGAGILNVEKLLAAPLPPTALAAGLTSLHASTAPRQENDMDRLVRYFPALDPGSIRRRIIKLLNTDEESINRFLAVCGDELSFQLATDPGLREVLEKKGWGSAQKRKRYRKRLRRNAELMRTLSKPLRSQLQL